MAADSSSSLHNPSKPQKRHQNASRMSSSLYKAAAFVCVLAAILPISPSGTPEPPPPPSSSAAANRTALARGLELLRLLLAGVAISYGLFSRRNSDHHPPELDREPAAPRRTWSYSRRSPEEPLAVMVAEESGGAREEEPLLLPVRGLKSGGRAGKEDVVLPSPIPWRSRSSAGRMEVKEEPKSFQKSSAPPPPPPPLPLGVGRKDGVGPYGGRSVRTVRPPTLPRSESAKINELRAKMAIESDSEEEDSESSDAEVLPGSASAEREGTEEEEENEVDRKADEFIAKFREQIRLQRIASLKRLTEQRTQSGS